MKYNIHYNLSRFSELDIYLFKEGNHTKLYDKMVYVDGLIKSYTKILKFDQEMEGELKTLFKKNKFNDSSLLNVKQGINPTERIVKYSIIALIIIYLIFIIFSKIERNIFSYNNLI